MKFLKVFLFGTQEKGTINLQKSRLIFKHILECLSGSLHEVSVTGAHDKGMCFCTCGEDMHLAQVLVGIRENMRVNSKMCVGPVREPQKTILLCMQQACIKSWRV